MMFGTEFRRRLVIDGCHTELCGIIYWILIDFLCYYCTSFLPHIPNLKLSQPIIRKTLKYYTLFFMFCDWAVYR